MSDCRRVFTCCTISLQTLSYTRLFVKMDVKIETLNSLKLLLISLNNLPEPTKVGLSL